MFDTRAIGHVPEVAAVDPRRAVEELSQDELETELTDLAAQIAAAQARQLELTAELDRREQWAAQGCTSMAHWLGWRCGMPPGAARDQVALAHKLEKLDKVASAMAQGKLTYWQARAIARAATPSTEDKFLEWATQIPAAQFIKTCRAYTKVRAIDEEPEQDIHRRRYLHYFFDETGDLVLSGRLPGEEGAIVQKGLEAAKRELWNAHDSEQDAQRDPYGPPKAPLPSEVDALVAVAESFIENGVASRSSGERYQVVVHVDADVLAGGEGTSCIENGGPLSAEAVQRLCCDSSLLSMLERDGKVIGAGRKTRKIPRHLRRALVARDKGCLFPGCGRSLYTDGHHVKFWTADQGETELDNLVLLCRFHHRLVHEGGYRVSLDDGVTRFFHPSGLEIAPAPALQAHGSPLSERTAPGGVPIDGKTIRGTWDGAPLDLGSAVACLVDMDARPDKYPENQAAP